MSGKSIVVGILAIGFLAGCGANPRVIPAAQRKPIDRAIVETPAGSALVLMVDGLTAPTAMCFDNEEGGHKGWLIVAEGGLGDNDVRIYGVKPDGALVTIYRRGQQIPFLARGFSIEGPVGGMVCAGGKIFITHRARDGSGMISAIGYDGSHNTVVADLPAQGDYGVTDIAMNPVNGRLYFGVGAATNSGVVGLDNWQVGWVGEHPEFCDKSSVDNLKLLGYRFDTKNPRAGLFGGADIAVTAPYQPFNSSNKTRIRAARNGKPSSAIFSISPGGGDLKIEAHGVRLPRGLAFNEFGNLFFTNNGMELRGTRPVKDDPDALLRLSPPSINTVQWYGFPDYSTELLPIDSSDRRYQPPMELVLKYGYPEVSALIDHRGSGLDGPDSFRSQLLYGVFPSQSGAAKLEFVPATGPFKSNRGSAIVALSGDRAPFATSGRKLNGPTGFKVVRVDVDPAKRQSQDFIRNTSGLPASRMNNPIALERPIDVKFGPDGALYVLDMGIMSVVNGKERITEGSGRLFKLVPLDWTSSEAATQPASTH